MFHPPPSQPPRDEPRDDPRPQREKDHRPECGPRPSSFMCRGGSVVHAVSSSSPRRREDRELRSAAGGSRFSGCLPKTRTRQTEASKVGAAEADPRDQASRRADARIGSSEAMLVTPLFVYRTSGSIHASKFQATLTPRQAPRRLVPPTRRLESNHTRPSASAAAPAQRTAGSGDRCPKQP